ncbi:MAG TPA: hypothetical protein VJK27_14565 [Terriglobales bacterium]|jgi:hypothetical protein|nr:hypothetical protein [Terriglobales bacterium]
MIDGPAARIKRVLGTLVRWLEQSRAGGAFVAGVRAAARSVGQTVHQLWLEVTGFTFLAMAGVGAISLVREYGRYQSGRAIGHEMGAGRLILAICFTVSFAWFGLSSFWRVNRKKARSKS